MRQSKYQGIVCCKLLCALWAPVNLLTRAQCCWNTAVPLWEQKLPCQYSCAPPEGPTLPLTAAWGLSCHFPLHNLNMTKWWWSHTIWGTRAQTSIYQVLGCHLLSVVCIAIGPKALQDREEMESGKRQFLCQRRVYVCETYRTMGLSLSLDSPWSKPGG